MERAIDHFKRSHPTLIQCLRVIVVDKDLNEIRVLESNFPDAGISHLSLSRDQVPEGNEVEARIRESFS